MHPLHEYGRGSTVRFTGSTHDERALITKDRSRIDALNRHLVAKIEEHRHEIEMVDTDLQDGSRTLVVGYGVTAGAVRMAVRQARRSGVPLSCLVLHSLWPVPETALLSALDGVDRVVIPELNPGLYRREIERIAPHVDVVGIERIDGDLVTPQQILEVA